MHEPIWCMSISEPFVVLSDRWWEDVNPWVRLWHSYVVLPSSHRRILGNRK